MYYNDAQSVQSDNTEKEIWKDEHQQSNMIILIERKENINIYKKEFIKRGLFLASVQSFLVNFLICEFNCFTWSSNTLPANFYLNVRVGFWNLLQILIKHGFSIF